MKKVILTSALLALLASCARDEIPAIVDASSSLKIGSVSLNEMKTKSGGTPVGSQIQVQYAYTNQLVADRRYGVYEYSTLDGAADPTWHPKTPADNLVFGTPPQGEYHQVAAFVPIDFFKDRVTGTTDNDRWFTWLDDPGYYDEVNAGPWTLGTKDLCVFYNNDITPSSPTINPTLEHMFAMLHLQLSKESDFLTTSGQIQQVKIKAKGLEDKRRFNVNMFSWWDQLQSSGHEFFTKSFDVSGQNLHLNALTVDQPTLHVRFLMLPFAFDAGSVVTLTVRVDGVNYDVDIPQSKFALLDQGLRTVIEIKFTKTGLQFNSITQRNWDDVNVTNGVPLNPTPVNNPV